MTQAMGDDHGPVYDAGMWLADNLPEITAAAQDPKTLVFGVLGAAAVGGALGAGARLLPAGARALKGAVRRAPGEITLGFRAERFLDALVKPPVKAAFLDRVMHYQIVAPTGQGKTTLLKRMVLEDLKQGHTVVVLETTGDLGPALLEYADALGILPRTYYFDPTHEYAMKWNPLRGSTERVAEQAVDTVSAAAQSHDFYRDFNADVMRNMVHAAKAYAGHQGREADMELIKRFLTDGRWLAHILGVQREKETGEVRLDAPFLDEDTRLWFEQEFYEWDDEVRRRYAIGLKNIIRKLLATEKTVRALCPKEGDRHLELGPVLESGGLIVLRVPSNPLGVAVSQTVASWILQHLQHETQGRRRDRRRPVCVYLDEVHVLLGHHNSAVAQSFSTWITQVRKDKVAVHLAYQSFSQLPQSLKGVLGGSARNKLIAGGLLGQDARDAQDLLGHVEREVEDHRESGGLFMGPYRRSRGTRRVVLPRYTLEEIEALPKGLWFFKGVKGQRQLPPVVIRVPMPPPPQQLRTRPAPSRRRGGRRRTRTPRTAWRRPKATASRTRKENMNHMNAPNRDPAGPRRSLLARARDLLAPEPPASTSTTPAVSSGQGATLRQRRLTTALKWLFWALVAALVGFLALNLFAPAGALGPGVALAQQGGDGGGAGGSIEGAIQNARDWLASIMVSLGGLGFIASVAIKAVARTNENMHHAAHMGMTGSGIAVLAGLLVNDIIGLIASWAGG